MKPARERKFRLKLSPSQVLFRSALICGLIGVVVFGVSLQKIERHPLSSRPLVFEPQQAHNFMRDLSKGFPNRVTWSDQRKRATAWLKSEFQKLGYSPRGMQFSETIAGKQYTDLENVFVEKRGTKHPDQIIAMMAHYDVTDTTVEGAMDDASGVGVVLELARVFAKQETDRSLLFILTDSEEFGAFWGARAFAQTYEKADQIIATLNFDFVGAGKQTRIITLCSGLKQGYTPLWLREMALDSLRSVGGVEVVDLQNVIEHTERAILIPPADHGPFLAAGIPAFNWAGQTDNFAYQMAHYHHTPADTVEAMEVESFAPYGRAAERLVYSLDEMTRLPTDFRNSSYWKITDTLYLDGWITTILHILAFIPFLAFSFAKFGTSLRRAPRAKMMRVLANEAKNAGILLGSFLLGYVVIILLPALRLITQYESFPATQKSLILYTPNFIAILAVLAAVAAIFWIFKRTFAEPDDDAHDEKAVEIRQALHAAFITIIIVLAFLKNSYLGTLLLLPPAYFWTFIRSRKRREDRILNGLLLLGGAITFVAMTIVLTTIFHVGVVYWYLFLAAAYGLISAYSVVLFLMALTIMIRLFRSFVL